MRAGIANFFTIIGALAVISMAVHIAAEVASRNFFSISIPATSDIVTRYYMLSIALLPLAWVELNNRMIKVELISNFCSQRLSRLLDKLTQVISVSVYAVLTVGTFNSAVEQYDVGAYVLALNTQIPIWPSYFILPLAFTAALIVSLKSTAN